MGKTPQDHLSTEGQYLLKPFEPIPAFFSELKPPAINTPSDWFAHEYPDQRKQWGPAFLEMKYSHPVQGDQIRPVSMNFDCMAAILGGRKDFGHDVVYSCKEEQFYFRDWDGNYVPTTDDKLKTLLSQQLLRCAESFRKGVDIEPLFNEHRSDKQLSEVIRKAKSILAVSDGFFEGVNGALRKIDGRVIHPCVDSPHELFIKQKVVRCPDTLLLMNEFWESFTTFCKERDFPTPTNKNIRKISDEIIRKEYGVVLRKDLKDERGKYVTGWKNLALASQEHRNRTETHPGAPFKAEPSVDKVVRE